MRPSFREAARNFAQGKSVRNPPESLKLFAFCQGIKFTHLPVAGGIYDQHPQLIAEWRVIFAAQSKQQQEEQRKNEANSKAGKRNSGVAGRRGR